MDLMELNVLNKFIFDESFDKDRNRRLRLSKGGTPWMVKCNFQNFNNYKFL